MITIVRRIVSDIIIYSGIVMIAFALAGSLLPETETRVFNSSSSKPITIERQ